MNYKQMIDKLLPVAKKAGQEIMEIYKEDFEVDYKDNNSPLTKADQNSNEVIVNYLKETYPQMAILSEESKDDKSRLDNKYCFIVDPLDGTKEFVKRNGEFTVNIALSKNNKSVLGIIYVPVTKEMYYAFENGGAFYKNEDMRDFKQIKVTDKEKDLNLVMSRSHASDELKQLIENNEDLIKDTKRAGSSLKGCLIAKGKAEVYFRFNPTMEWDTAAMQIIVEEAGGIFKQLDGTEMRYNRKNSLNDKGFLVLNKEKNNLLKNK